MAARHFSFKSGKVGTGAKHAEYVAGVGKYARDDVLHLSDHNLPEWATDGCDFFVQADLHERANGRSYSEIEFAIPREATDPVAYARQYAGDLLGDRHVYRLAVHDKLAADGGRNTHGHLMFSERRLDGVARDRELFFRRANKKNPERGGAAKDRTFNDRQHIDKLRRGYEAHALAQGIALDLRSNEAQGLGAAEPKIGPVHRRDDEWREGRVRKVRALRRVRQVRDEIESTRRELRASRRELARHAANACQDVERRSQRPLRSPLEAMRAEPRQGRTVYRWQRGAAAGFTAMVDRGDRITCAGKPSTPKARAVVELAKAKGWTSLVLTGSEEFKRHAVREALRAGVRIANPELTEFVSQLQKELDHEQSHNRPKRVFSAWQHDSGKNRQGLRSSRLIGPQRMPDLRDPRARHGQPEAGNAVLQRAIPGHRDGDRRMHSLPTGDLENMPPDQRLELARRWVMTTASVDAAEAYKLADDPERLLRLYDASPDAQRQALIERQRAEGVPEALLGFQIDRDASGVTQGTVRHAGGKRLWIEPADRPGHVVPVAPTSQSLRPGQRVVVRSSGEVVPDRDNTPRP